MTSQAVTEPMTEAVDRPADQPVAKPRPVVTGPWPQRMVNPIQPYAWGSTTALAQLQGRPASGAPEAELWMGAHPSAPSGVEAVDGNVQALDALIGAAPVDILGADVVAAFGARLPFLLKVLAIDKPLSLQVHPTAERAAAVWAGTVPLADEHRYADPFHKPELAYALAASELLSGFRLADQVAYLLGLVDCERVRTVAAPLLNEGEADGAACVQEAFRLLVTWPAEDRAALAADVAAQAQAVLSGADDAPADGQGQADGEPVLSEADRHALRWVLRLAAQHPDDPLVAAPLLLELVRLAPGGTLYVPAGAPHAYLSGLVVEVMANSDNVLRAGLTRKPISVDELLAIVDSASRPVLDTPEVLLSPHETAWRPPVQDFQLTRLRATSSAPVAAFPHLCGPQIVLCTQGPVVLAAGAFEVRLRPGESAFVGAGGAPLTVAGPGEVFRAASGLVP